MGGKSAHTSGPWTTRGHRVESSGRLIASVLSANSRFTCEDKANRSLITAAPEMFAALRALLPEVDHEIDQRQHGGNDEAWHGLKALSDAGHAAIAKAEGQSS